MALKCCAMKTGSGKGRNPLVSVNKEIEDGEVLPGVESNGAPPHELNPLLILQMAIGGL